MKKVPLAELNQKQPLKLRKRKAVTLLPNQEKVRKTNNNI
jgi:hypothetical protein